MIHFYVIRPVLSEDLVSSLSAWKILQIRQICEPLIIMLDSFISLFTVLRFISFSPSSSALLCFHIAAALHYTLSITWQPRDYSWCVCQSKRTWIYTTTMCLNVIFRARLIISYHIATLLQARKGEMIFKADSRTKSRNNNWSRQERRLKNKQTNKESN